MNNYSGQDLYNLVQDQYLLLDICIKSLASKGKEKANSEMNYRIALRIEILKLRDDKIPVTIISDMCRGNREVAKLKYDRDVTEVLYETVMQKIYAIKLQIRMLENQIGVEYGKN